MSKIEKSLLFVIIAVTSLMIVFFGVRKVNYHCDEIWTYGLSNNIGGINPEFEIGETYTRMGPFESFTIVQDGEAFNYANVWENQAKDVHPPFYYILIHTICSIFKGSFSKWYGIGLNMFWMILILPLLYMLAKEMIGSISASLGIAIAYATSVIFLDTMLLIRMYAQFTFFVVLIMYLFKKNWDKKPEKHFLIKLGITLFFGMLTHYYFLFVAFFMCLIYGIRLILAKNKTDIRNYIISLGIAGILYGITWYHILAHIFNGYRGAEAISKATSFGGLISGFVGMASILNDEAFSGLILLFCILVIVYVVLLVKDKKLQFDYTVCIFLCGIFYMLVVGKICPIVTTRYIMPIAWIFILCAFIVVWNLIKLFVKNKKMADIAVVAIFCVIAFANIAKRDFYIPMDYNNLEQMVAISNAEGKTVVVCVDLNWKILYDFVLLQNADSYVFADKDDFQKILNAQKEDYILAVNLEDDRDKIVKSTKAELLYDDGKNYYYLVKK
ncbi:hypothetical protein [Butyrivibrio sp. AE3004]|uniref:hypothetical protein n=1 Tax=Butyrivibrio sp. AE3004 TaxID=1506994 RepID=UPI000493D903|nr:hypothetical protein [Butyrivibrio sp. AE3004]